MQAMRERWNGIGCRKARGALQYDASALLRQTLLLFKSLYKLFEKLSKPFRSGNMLQTIAVFPEPSSDDRSNLTVGRRIF